MGWARGDVPQPHAADHAAVFAGHKRKTVRRQTALAQALRGLAVAAIAERRIEQSFTGRDIGERLGTNGDHGLALPASYRRWHSTRVDRRGTGSRRFRD